MLNSFSLSWYDETRLSHFTPVSLFTSPNFRINRSLSSSGICSRILLLSIDIQQQPQEMETLNLPRRFGQDITNLRKLNLSQLNKREQNHSIRYKSQRDVSLNSQPTWQQASIKKRNSSLHGGKPPDHVTTRNDSCRSARTHTIRFCDVKQIMEIESKRIMIERIDQHYRDKPQFVSAYGYEIQEYLKSIDCNYLPTPDYQQTLVTWKMRSILIDWMIEVLFKFKMRQETLYMTVNLLDRYLSQRQVTRQHFQLVGVACILIATKVEEIHQIRTKDLSYITDKAFSSQEIVAQESSILQVLNFSLTGPTIYSFVNRLQQISPLSQKHFQLAQLVLEIYLVNQPQNGKSLFLASSVFYCVRKIKRYQPIWPQGLANVSEYSEDQLKANAKSLFKQFVEFQQTQQSFHNSLRLKYQGLKYSKLINH